MASEVFSTRHLDYLQRSGIALGRLSPGTPRTSAPPNLRRFWQVKSIGRIAKALPSHLGDGASLPSEDVLVGVSGSRIPIAYLIRGTPAGISLYLGTWSSIEHEGASAAQLARRPSEMTCRERLRSFSLNPEWTCFLSRAQRYDRYSCSSSVSKN